MLLYADAAVRCAWVMPCGRVVYPGCGRVVYQGSSNTGSTGTQPSWSSGQINNKILRVNPRSRALGPALESILILILVQAQIEHGRIPDLDLELGLRTGLRLWPQDSLRLCLSTQY